MPWSSARRRRTWSRSRWNSAARTRSWSPPTPTSTRRRPVSRRPGWSTAARSACARTTCSCPKAAWMRSSTARAGSFAACSRRSSPTPTTARASTNRTSTGSWACSTTPAAREHRSNRLRRRGVAAGPGVAQDRADDRARCQRGDADRTRGDFRAGAGRHGLPDVAGGDRLHQRPAGAVGRVLVWPRWGRLPAFRPRHPQRRGGPQRLCRPNDPVGCAVRWRRPQRDGGVSRQGRFRRVHPLPDRRRFGPSVQHHRDGGAAVPQVHEAVCGRAAPVGAQENSSSHRAREFDARMGASA